MTKTIRQYIKEHGRAAARKHFGNSIDDMPIMIDSQQYGVLKRYIHPAHQRWVWEAVVTVNDMTYTFIDFESQIVCLDWAYRKVNALQNPQFALMLKQAISSSPMTIEMVAEASNCSRFSIHKWMRGESYPPVHILQRITMALYPNGWSSMFDAWSLQIEMEQ